MKNRECEERVMIDFDQYMLLVQHYIVIDPQFRFIDIENTYLDDENLSLINNHKMMRIRKFNNQQELTLKIPNDKGTIEINEKIDSHPEIDKLLPKPFSQYHPIATLKTHRIEVKEKDYLVVIDQNLYNGIIDYDLEVEASSMEEAKAAILDICNRFHLEYKENYISKSRRAINSRRIN